MTDCRWWIDAATDGPTNMAIDEALAEQAAHGSRATWRFYGWSNATLSLGYFQRYDERAGHAPSADCAVVRRPSGGGAIVHDREITYCLALPIGHSWARHRRTLYMRAHAALVEALAALGVAARCNPAAAPGKPRDQPFLCFQRRAEGDVLVEGHKIAGSAQRRTRGAILQHGSVLLARSAAAAELPGINDLVARPIDPTELRKRWLACLDKALPGRWIADALGDDERRRASELAEQKYGSDTWTRRT